MTVYTCTNCGEKFTVQFGPRRHCKCQPSTITYIVDGGYDGPYCMNAIGIIYYDMIRLSFEARRQAIQFLPGENWEKENSPWWEWRKWGSPPVFRFGYTHFSRTDIFEIPLGEKLWAPKWQMFAIYPNGEKRIAYSPEEAEAEMAYYRQNWRELCRPRR